MRLSGLFVRGHLLIVAQAVTSLGAVLRWHALPVKRQGLEPNLALLADRDFMLATASLGVCQRF